MRIETGILFCFSAACQPARLAYQNTTTADSSRIYAQRGEPALSSTGVCPKKYSNLGLNVSAPADYILRAETCFAAVHGARTLAQSPDTRIGAAVSTAKVGTASKLSGNQYAITHLS
jgi:hypothetical protein